MAIRKNLNPRQMDLQPEMRDILMRNGMQAHIIANGDGYQLAVQGHDSPLLTYNLTEKQMLALTDWGTNSANKKAYNVFTCIIGKDFYMPRNLVHARNANGQQQVAPQADVLQNLQAVVTPVETRPRSKEPAKPYKELISSPVYFSNEKWQECLSSHGIIIDEKAKTLTIQSESTKSDMVYDLNDEELKALTNNSVKQVSVAKRLEILNNVIKDDFADKITMDMLNSKERIHIGLRPEVQQELDSRMQMQSTVEPLQVQQEPVNNKVGIVDGQDLNESKGWFREGKHGREVSVGEIRVEPAELEDKYRMTAIINGERVSHEITQKQYDKFMAVDDYHRMKLFSKIFGEVDMKDRTDLGTKIGAALLAGLGVAAEVGSELHRAHGSPVVIVDHHHGAVPPPHPYFKPGVDTPMDVAARNFEAAMNQEILHPHMGKGL